MSEDIAVEIRYDKKLNLLTGFTLRYPECSKCNTVFDKETLATSLFFAGNYYCAGCWASCAGCKSKLPRNHKRILLRSVNMALPPAHPAKTLCS
jgi:hypothetical protein